MFKSISLFAALLLLAFSASWQTQEKQEAPQLRLTLATEKTVWKPGEAAPVHIKIENLSASKVELTSRVSFMIDNRAHSDEMITLAKGVFWSPVSLTKTYAKNASTCQNDLTKARVKTVRGTNIVEIFPPKNTLSLKKGGVREFSFDLTDTCWNHSVLSVYPNTDIFTVVERYSDRFDQSRAFKVYFQMGFKIGAAEFSRREAPIFENIKSNEVEISLN